MSSPYRVELSSDEARKTAEFINTTRNQNIMKKSLQYKEHLIIVII